MKLRSIATLAVAGAFTLPMFAAGSAFAADVHLVDGSQKADLIITKLDTPRASAGDGTQISTTGHNPIPDVTFQAERITSIDLATNAGWASVASMTVSGAQAASRDAAISVTTADPTGIAKFNDLPVGLYLVTETNAPAGVVKSDPFLVTLPMTDPTSHDKWMEYNDLSDADGATVPDYVVHAYPKNDAITVTKTVNDADDYKAGDTVVWAITGKIPDMDGTGANQINSYALRDALDPRLSFSSLSIQGFDSTSGQAFTLDETTDYVVSTPIVGTKQVDFTQAGRDKLESHAAGGNGTVVATLSTTVLDGSLGEISNQASLLVNSGDWTNDAVTSNTVKTVWADLELTKVDQAGAALPGAEFDLGYLDASSNWIVIGHQTTAIVTQAMIDAEQAQVVADPNYAPLFVASDLGKAKAVFKTIRVEDFENNAPDATPREYFLMETKAPAGYELLAERIAVDLKAADQTASGVVINQAPIANVLKTDLPLTGGVGAAGLIIGSVVIGGVVFLVARRRRSSETA